MCRHFAGHGPGLLELTTQSLQRSGDYQKDFGMLRVGEILGGDPHWDESQISYNGLCQGRPLHEVFNAQMIIDIAVAPRRGGKNFITLSRPVLQRMLDGKTLGQALRPLGTVQTSFYGRKNREENSGQAAYERCCKIASTYF